MRRGDFRKLAAGLIVGLGLFVSGCSSSSGPIDLGLSSFGNRTSGLDLPATVDFYPDHEVLNVAKNHFDEGHYGHAARYFERAVEIAPANAEAWLGLAASYDRIRRFDLADRAYRRAGELVGHRAEYHNNVGYSYLLRGDVLKARDKFLEAARLDPTNLTVANNLQLLKDSVRRAQAN
jgi:Flp pilus assembly protein TadD